MQAVGCGIELQIQVVAPDLVATVGSGGSRVTDTDRAWREFDLRERHGTSNAAYQECHQNNPGGAEALRSGHHNHPLTRSG